MATSVNTTGRKLLIIEAPGKLKKLKAILGSEYDIRASGGHIRELASDDAESLGFEFIGDRVTCRWTARDARARSTISDLKAAAKQASAVILATDEDREGETIAWHLAQALNLVNPKRITYREITESAVRSAIANPRLIDQNLVNAGVCRSVLDKLVGYRGSPLVWQLNAGAKSVGRVQSAALHLVVEREQKITEFRPQDYWNVFVNYAEGFRAYYSRSHSKDEVEQTDDAADPSDRKEAESDRITSRAEADRLVVIAQSHPHQVRSIEGKTVTRTPPPPFTTSTLQQAAGAKLKFSPDRAMELAQKLYEQGHVTYHRTDATFLSPEFCESVRQWLSVHDSENLPQKATQHRSSKNAQEAHEAVRPTHIDRSAAALQSELDADAFALYILIWKRTIASLCAPARIRQTRIYTQSGEALWLAKGQVVEFEGFAKYWRSLGSDTELPALTQNQSLHLQTAAHEQKQTQPPPRYSEAQLVQLMERRGIGRPSTYAPTIQTLKTRQYIGVIKNKVQPTPLGIQVDQFLVQALPKLVDVEFTAEMEANLDLVATGTLNWESWLIDWNRSDFAPAIAQAKQILPSHARAAALRQSSEVKCQTCQRYLVQIPSKKVSKGYFLKCESCPDLVMFWNDRSNAWELPKKSEASVAELTEFSCPVCKKPLEIYHYQKEGQSKPMLRCSDAKARSQNNHADAVYFQANGAFFSRKYGNPQTLTASAVQLSNRPAPQIRSATRSQSKRQEHS